MGTKELDDFIRYAKERFDCEIEIKKSKTPDSFAGLFGASFLDEQDDTELLNSFESNFCYENNAVEVELDFDGEMTASSRNVDQAA